MSTCNISFKKIRKANIHEDWSCLWGRGTSHAHHGPQKTLLIREKDRWKVRKVGWCSNPIPLEAKAGEDYSWGYTAKFRPVGLLFFQNLQEFTEPHWHYHLDREWALRFTHQLDFWRQSTTPDAALPQKHVLGNVKGDLSFLKIDLQIFCLTVLESQAWWSHRTHAEKQRWHRWTGPVLLPARQCRAL